MPYPKVHPVSPKIAGIVLLIGAAWLISQGLSAQAAPVGPLLAVDTAAQDSIIVYDLGTLARRELRLGAGGHRVWGFSPDACRLLYTLTDSRGISRAYTARIDGSDSRPLVRYDELPPDRWSAWQPQWSPDGTRVAFTLITDRDEGRTHHIAWVDAAGGTPERYSVSGDEHEAAWSPDGRWLAYIAYEQRVAGADIASTAPPTPIPAPGQRAPESPMLREADLWVVSYDAASKYRLTRFPTGSMRAPRWSPDSELIGFTYSPSAANDQFYMIANQPGAIPTQLSYAWSLILDMTWLPDSSAMLAAVRDFRGVRENRLWRIPLVGMADDAATLYLDEPGLAYADYPRFSPDARWLALRSAYALALVDLTDGAWRLIDEDRLGNTPPVWSLAGFESEPAC